MEMDELSARLLALNDALDQQVPHDQCVLMQKEIATRLQGTGLKIYLAYVSRALGNLDPKLMYIIVPSGFLEEDSY